MNELLQKKYIVSRVRPSLLIGFLALPLMAQAAFANESSPVSEIQECRALESDSERLLCYDTVADGGVFGEEQLQKAQAESFGSTEKKVEKTVDQITVSIVRVQKGANRIHYFHTDSGDVWKQTGSGRGNWNLPVPFSATIKSGVLSSFFLVTEGGKSVRVKRVR